MSGPFCMLSEFWQPLVGSGYARVMPESLSPDQPIVRDIVLDVTLPATLPVSRIQARRITILPDHPAGLHIHNGPVVGSVVAGSVFFQIEGQPEHHLHAGDLFYEPEATRIARFDAGRDGVTFLAYFPLRPGQDPTLEFPDA